MQGKFIVLDGPDGCGKTTQVQLLSQWLRRQGVETVSFREPGGTVIGEKIRQILLNPEHITMNTATEVLLYMSARAQVWVEKISPALEANKCVLLDRWLSSTCAYQGYAGGFGIDNVIRITEGSLARIWPDLTIIMDVDMETSTKRMKRQPDRMEKKGSYYHNKVRQGFIELARRPNFELIDGSGDIQQVHKRVIQAIERY